MSETLAQTQARLTAFVNENAPNIDTSPSSVFSELLINTTANVQNYVQNDYLALSAGQTVATVLAAPSATVTPIVDQLASNYDVTRYPGQTATGLIRVYITSSTIGTVSAGTVFIAENLGYAYSPVNDLSPTPILLNQNNQTVYYFDVPVVSAIIGANQNLASGTQFTLKVASSILTFVNATANGAFAGGQDQETDQQLITRFRAGMSAKNFTSQDSIASQLQTEFPGFQSIYLANYMDPLNTRAANNPMGLKVPGCVDLYLRNSTLLQQVSFVINGTSADFTADNGTYTIYINPGSTISGQTDASGNPILAYGLYKILSVQVITDNNVPLTTLVLPTFTTVYGMNTATNNNVQTVQEARFSVYQTATLSVAYLATPGDTTPPQFLVTALVPANLNTVQQLLSSDSTRLPNADYLVKGVVPCIVSVNLSLIVQNANTFGATSLPLLQADIFNYINGLGVGQSIAVSNIINLCHKYPITQVRLPIVLKGIIYVPNYVDSHGHVVDYSVTLNGTDTLTIPSLLNYGVNANNTAFFTNYQVSNTQENINISFE